jgi:hypothetical protein
VPLSDHGACFTGQLDWFRLLFEKLALRGLLLNRLESAPMKVHEKKGFN